MPANPELRDLCRRWGIDSATEQVAAGHEIDSVLLAQLCAEVAEIREMFYVSIRRTTLRTIRALEAHLARIEDQITCSQSNI